MMNWYHNGFDGNHFFSFYIICSIYLFIFDKDKRWKLVVPSLLLTIFILNPVCYKFIWAKTIGYSYWRLFWAIPIVPVVAMTFVDVLMPAKNKKRRAGLAVLMALLCLRSGAWVYSNADTNFARDESIYKLPGNAVEVVGWLTSHDENPRVVNDITLARYAIQISPKIQQAFGRWGEGNVYTETGRLFYGTFGESCIDTSYEDFDWDKANRVMQSENFKYLVIPLVGRAGELESGDPVLLDSGFKFEKAVGGYGIYSAY